MFSGTHLKNRTTSLQQRVLSHCRHCGNPSWQLGAVSSHGPVSSRVPRGISSWDLVAAGRAHLAVGTACFSWVTIWKLPGTWRIQFSSLWVKDNCRKHQVFLIFWKFKYDKRGDRMVVYWEGKVKWRRSLGNKDPWILLLRIKRLKKYEIFFASFFLLFLWHVPFLFMYSLFFPP